MRLRGNSEDASRQHNSCAMGWITEEYSRRRLAQSSQAPHPEGQHAVANLWLELRDGLQADVNEYNRWGGAAGLSSPV
jgi:hypothetical protein